MPNFGTAPNFGNNINEEKSKNNTKRQFEIEDGIKPPEAKKIATTDLASRPAIPPSVRVWPVPSADFKAGIDMVVAVVRNYLRAMSPGDMPKTFGKEWEAQAVRNKEQLEQDLRALNLGDVINFEE